MRTFMRKLDFVLHRRGTILSVVAYGLILLNLAFGAGIAFSAWAVHEVYVAAYWSPSLKHDTLFDCLCVVSLSSTTLVLSVRYFWRAARLDGGWKKKAGKLLM